MKPRRLAVFGLTAGLLGGGSAGLLMTGTTLAGAQTAEAPATPATPDPAAGATKTPRADWAKSALDGLVADGTITQAQADKVQAALRAARPGKGMGKARHAKLDAAASALGMTVGELRTALQGGKSLAAIAQEKGIDSAKVVDALVAELKTHLDQHVASGRKTQAEADEMLADARTRIQAFVNGEAPAGRPGFGFGGHGHRGHRGPKADAPAGGTAPSSSSSSGATITS